MHVIFALLLLLLLAFPPERGCVMKDIQVHIRLVALALDTPPGWLL
jgi:hypothetical protein